MSEGMTFSPWKSLALLLPLSLFLCPPICPSVSLSVIFFSLSDNSDPLWDEAGHISTHKY